MTDSRTLIFVIAAGCLALWAPLVHPLLTGRVLVYNDLAWFHLPLRWLYQQALWSGDGVLWTPAIFAGLYLHGEGQAGLFHPLHQLLYRSAPLATAFMLELSISYPAAFAGMGLFLRRLGFGWVAALAGAMLFAFGGFNVLHHHHMNMVAVVAHLPWTLAAADVAILSDSARSRRLAAAALAAILGSAVLLGFPQAVWWILLTLAAYAVFRAATERRWTRLLPCALAAALGLALGALQILPTADAAAHSERAGAPAEFALTFSLHPSNLLQLWSPYFFVRGAHSTRDYMWFHEFGIYSGALLTLAPIWCWARRRALPARRALIVSATLYAIVAVVLALGRYGGLAVLLTHLPLIQSLRVPARYILLAQFALTILAAITIDDLLAIARGRTAPPGRLPRALWIPAALGLVTTLALNGRWLPLGSMTFASPAAAAPGVATIAAVTVLMALAARRVPWALAALLVVTTADLWAWGMRFVTREPPRHITELTAGIPAAPDRPADAYAAAPADGPYQHNVLVLRGYRLATGYAGLFPSSRHPLGSETALRLSGTRWVFDARGTRTPAAGGVARVRIVDEQGHEATGMARLVTDRPGSLVVHVDAPGRRIVAFTERFHRGWWAKSGGEPVPVTRVGGDFLGCVVDAGVQRVELGFRPASFVSGVAISAAALSALVALLTIGFRSAPEPERPGSSPHR